MLRKGFDEELPKKDSSTEPPLQLHPQPHDELPQQSPQAHDELPPQSPKAQQQALAASTGGSHSWGQRASTQMSFYRPLPRPRGTKAKKRRRKEEGSYSAGLLAALTATLQVKAEREIMMVNTAGISPIRAAWFKMQQRKIIIARAAKRKLEVDDDEEDDACS